MNNDDFLSPGQFVDSDHPAVITFASEAIGNSKSTLKMVLNFFYTIRDNIRYDPYLPVADPASYRASDAVLTSRGWCVPKAALLAACCRIYGIPARPGYADVRNHLATDRLLDLLGTDIFAWHSYCDIFIGDKWVKATPAFNLSLCQKFGLKPLDFDGENDSLFHEFDQAGNKHMEYLKDRGPFNDVPFEDILSTFREMYNPEYISGAGGDFHAEATTTNKVDS
ncbi:MAG: transglutaminase family protein [Pseudomonadota bacterium]|nr:transglutaminase family protein [Pseudomonadota bacterium]